MKRSTTMSTNRLTDAGNDGELAAPKDPLVSDLQDYAEAVGENDEYLSGLLAAAAERIAEMG